MAKKEGKVGRPAAPEGTEKKSYKLPPTALVQVKRIRAFYGLPTDTAALMLALTVADRALPADYVPPGQ